MKKNLDKVVKQMIENGTPADQVLKMPFYYILQILDERHLNTVDTDDRADTLFTAL
ncbi:phage tail assembly chaperone GT [Staphylococcus haemolyticus]|uniref:phage tail assembly chaperone GT n=1 Tax=Staphylococcus haemolyticus TaxID=1283 RepID=UPI0030D2A900